jgi:N-hydroxyarylamine O-acetyltransferase
MNRLHIESYFARIGYGGSAEPTHETLCSLHLAHLLTVPFENLSVRRHEPIVLDEAQLFDKIVRRRRGGFCYELNGLFAALLDAMGFRVQRLSGRVGPTSIDFDHMALKVDIEEPWLADIGFGDSFQTPLRLADRDPQSGGDGRRYRLDESAAGLMLLREEAGEWRRQYAFTLHAWPLSAFEPGCRYHQTSPDSTFTQKTVVSLPTRTGRITLADRKLITTNGGDRQEQQLADDAAVEAVLEQRFGIRR